MKKHIVKLSHCLIITLLFTSCQKVIDIDLNSASPQIVIEAEISDQAAPYTVKLSQTVNFNQTNSFPAVSGAIVIINDNLGNTETLIETSSGIYTASTLQGTSGRTYTLTVTANQKNYTATSTMPNPVDIDTLTIQTSSFGGGKIINVQFQDPVGIINYYRFIKIHNGIPQKSIFFTDDRFLRDGLTIIYPLFSPDNNSELNPGDSVTVLLQAIDNGVYEYFRTLTGIGGAPPASPPNPTSNLSNGALGYFSAYAVRSKTVVIP